LQDGWGNQVEQVWFEGHTSHLEIRVRLRVETTDCAPSGPVLSWPLDYGARRDVLAPFLVPLATEAELRPLLGPLLALDHGDVVERLLRLNHAIHGLYHRGVRIDGPARSPAQTLALGEGVCRDLAVLFMAASRQLGIAARFVSGYQQGDGYRAQRYLHAWPEVYLPGSGWLGFDPTHDGLVGDDHVAVAAGPAAETVSPVQGSYSFEGAVLDSSLETDIRITTRPSR
jgi:transglutaminase-like putative cysteine protease